MKRIVLVGAGQLGSRHLQALALLPDKADIIVVDSSHESLATAKQRFESIADSARHRCRYVISISDVDFHTIDFAIVATNAAGRSRVIRELLESRECSFLLLEKVLFQKVSDYADVGAFLAHRHIKTFVNCPRRMFSIYREIKKNLVKEDVIHVDVVGNAWGLGCNGIHFVDLFNFLTGEVVTSWEANLSERVLNSKREGYKEFVGQLEGRCNSGSTIRLLSFEGGRPNISVRITGEKQRYVILEGLNRFWTEFFEPSWEAKESVFEMPYQSSLTHLVAENLFATGECELTSYDVSAKLHVPFIEILLHHYSKKINTDICPIT